MREKFAVVVVLLVAVALLSIVGLAPVEQTGQAIYYPEYSFSATSWKEAGSGQPEVHSSRYQELLARDTTVDYALQEGAFFDLSPEDAVFVGPEIVWFTGAEYSVDQKLALFAVPQSNRHRVRTKSNSVLVREDQRKVLRNGVVLIADEVFDAESEGLSMDRVRAVFPGVSSVTYSPLLYTGDVRYVNGKEVELMEVMPGARYTGDDRYIAVVRVGDVIDTVASFEKTTIGGLQFSLNEVSTLEQNAVLYISDVFTVEM